MNSEVSAKEVSIHPASVENLMSLTSSRPMSLRQLLLISCLIFVEFYFRFKIFVINHIELKIESTKLKITCSKS